MLMYIASFCFSDVLDYRIVCVCVCVCVVSPLINTHKTPMRK